MTIEQYRPSAEVALSNAQDVAVHRLSEWAQSAGAAHNIAQTLVQTSFVPDSFRNKPGEATAAILAGLEVGLQPMAALRAFDVIQGQAAPRAITLRAVVQSHGHEIEIVESSDTRCKMRGKRKGSQNWQTVTWTIDRAKQLGVTNKPNWKNQPQAMLVARATSEVARLIASDAILGIAYSVEEIADGGTVEQHAGDVIATVSEPGGTRKMSRRNLAAVEPIADDEPTEGEIVEESPLLNTSSALAKTMFATFNELNITDRAGRLIYVSDVLGHEVTSSSDMTDADAEAVIAALQSDIEQPFPADLAEATPDVTP